MFDWLRRDRSESRGPAGNIDHAGFVEVVEKRSATVVDVREPYEFAAGHVPGAVNLPMSRFSPDRLPSGRPVVLICASGARSAGALSKAVGAGRADVTHYPLGTNGWRMRGGVLET